MFAEHESDSEEDSAFQVSSQAVGKDFDFSGATKQMDMSDLAEQLSSLQVKPVRRIVTVHEDSAAAQPLRPQVGHNQAYFSAFFKLEDLSSGGAASGARSDSDEDVLLSMSDSGSDFDEDDDLDIDIDTLSLVPDSSLTGRATVRAPVAPILQQRQQPVPLQQHHRPVESPSYGGGPPPESVGIPLAKSELIAHPRAPQQKSELPEDYQRTQAQVMEETLQQDEVRRNAEERERKREAQRRRREERQRRQERRMEEEERRRQGQRPAFRAERPIHEDTRAAVRARGGLPQMMNLGELDSIVVQQNKQHHAADSLLEDYYGLEVMAKREGRHRAFPPEFCVKLFLREDDSSGVGSSLAKETKKKDSMFGRISAQSVRAPRMIIDIPHIIAAEKSALEGTSMTLCGAEKLTVFQVMEEIHTILVDIHVLDTVSPHLDMDARRQLDEERVKLSRDILSLLSSDSKVFCSLFGYRKGLRLLRRLLMGPVGKAVAIPILEMTCKDLTTAAYVLQATCSGARASNSGQDVDYLEHADALLVEVAALIKLFPIQAVEVFLTRCSEWASQPGMLTYACCTQLGCTILSSSIRHGMSVEVHHWRTHGSPIPSWQAVVVEWATLLESNLESIFSGLLQQVGLPNIEGSHMNGLCQLILSVHTVPSKRTGEAVYLSIFKNEGLLLPLHELYSHFQKDPMCPDLRLLVQLAVNGPPQQQQAPPPPQPPHAPPPSHMYHGPPPSQPGHVQAQHLPQGHFGQQMMHHSGGQYPSQERQGPL